MTEMQPSTNSTESLQPMEQGDFEYHLLRGHQRTDRSWKSTQELQTEYIRMTDDLIHQVVDGVKVKDLETGETHTEPVDDVVWLDKSARPVSWLMKSLWNQLAADKDGNVPEPPEHKFVNIDRNQWTDTIDPQGVGTTNVDQINPTIIRSLRSIFLSNPNDRNQGLTDEIDDAPTQFDGKTVLIVDEQRSSGRTLQYAEGFFKRAFPEANIAGTHWMGDTTVVNGAIGNADSPVWYDDKTDAGRGVGNRNIDRSRLSPSRAQRLGAWFLSTPFVGSDPLSDKLRIEIDHLAEDAKSGKVLVEPSRNREEDDYEERVLRFNEVSSLQEFSALRKARKE
jgi:hypothetical protein